MIYLPIDLFTPYIKGKEYAIDKNFEDATRSNEVQKGWLENDAKWLQNSADIDTYGAQVGKINESYKTAALGNTLLEQTLPYDVQQKQAAAIAAQLQNQGTSSNLSVLQQQNAINSKLLGAQNSALTTDLLGGYSQAYGGQLGNQIEKQSAYNNLFDPNARAMNDYAIESSTGTNNLLNNEFNASVLNNGIEQQRLIASANNQQPQAQAPVQQAVSTPEGTVDLTILNSVSGIDQLAEGQTVTVNYPMGNGVVPIQARKENGRLVPINIISAGTGFATSSGIPTL